MHSEKSELPQRKVAYVKDEELMKECDKIPNVCGRAQLVHNLIDCYGLLSDMEMIPCMPATEDDLISFHSSDYIKFLQKVDKSSDLEKHDEEQLEYGLGYDCPLVDGMYNFVQLIAGASISAAKVLVEGTADVAINWCGGWHHAQRDEAEGYCYVNDIVIAIHKLKEKYKRIVYIDLDLHHGNGVENAFAMTPSVMTVSFHKYELGFYPGTGALEDTGTARGRFHTVNIPLKDGLRDENFVRIFHSVIWKVWMTFRPQAAVVQCGADCINGDPACAFNLTPKGLGLCVKQLLRWRIPLLFLGGGGYNLPNTARCWTYLTSIIIGREIPSSIPDSNLDFLLYSPDFELDITPGNRADQNSEEYIRHILDTVSDNLNYLLH